MEYPVQSILIERKGATEEQLLKFLDVQETISIAIELNYQVAERLHLLRNTVSHLCNQKGI